MDIYRIVSRTAIIVYTVLFKSAKEKKITIINHSKRTKLIAKMD